jgi:hypothetical protein
MVRDSEDVDRPPKDLWRSEDEGEDPFVALGQMVKLASIGIWRKVSLRDKKVRPPGMQERSNSDSVLEIGRPVSFTDAGDQVLVGLVDEDTGDDKNPLLRTETTKMKATDDEVVVVQTEVVPTASIATKDS